MHSLTGTWHLFKLAVRRDRIKLPIWIVALAVMFISSAASVTSLYDTPQEQFTYASTTAPSVVSRVFGGPINGPDIGAIVMNETFLTAAIAVAFLSTLAVVRHTRQNEEEGRSEMIESGIVSRHASVVAALMLVTLVNIIMSVIVAVGLKVVGLPTGGSISAGLAVGAIGMTFAGVAAVAAQLADSARGANGLSAMAIGIAFLLRALGDGLGKLAPNGLSITSALPSWFSPIGWGQQIHSFTEGNSWIFILFFGLIVSLIGTAIYLMAKRDIGLGMITTKPGPAEANPKLLSGFGLARRLQRGVFRGWAITILILGVSYGLVIQEFQTFLEDNDQFREALGEIGGSLTDAFIGIMLSFMAVTIAAYGVQALLRLRSEESSGRIESVLGTGISRLRWMLSHIVYVVLGVVVLSLLTGLSMGLTYVLSSGVAWSNVTAITAAALTQASAILALTGFTVLIFSMLPRFSVAIAWGAYSACLLIIELGVLLRLPQWVLDFSPFGHLPIMPAESFELTPVVSLLAVAVATTAAGLWFFNRRDVTLT